VRQSLQTFEFRSEGPGALDITSTIAAWVGSSGIERGLLTLHVRHTSASLIVQENADPQVQRDLQSFLSRLVPHGDRLFQHTAEGPDDMPAHVRAALTSTTLSIPVLDGRVALGTWQAIYLWEHRSAPHRREVAAHLLGE